MSSILVTGGTGALGRDVVRWLLAAGSDVRVLSRRPRRDGDPAEVSWATGDLRTGAGLSEAVQDAAVIVHCASDPRRPRSDLTAATNLIAAAKTAATDRAAGTDGAAGTDRMAGVEGVAGAAAGGPHLVYVSIVGVDQVSFGYYKIKLEVERLVAESGLPWTVLRATQFHDLVCYLLQLAARLPVLMVPAGVSFQPVDTRDVAARLGELALGDPVGRAADFGGPQVRPVGDLARAWLAAAGRRRPLLGIRVPGKVFRGYAAGGHLTPDHPGGRITFEDFLREHISPAAHSAPYGRLH